MSSTDQNDAHHRVTGLCVRTRLAFVWIAVRAVAVAEHDEATCGESTMERIGDLVREWCRVLIWTSRRWRGAVQMNRLRDMIHRLDDLESVPCVGVVDVPTGRNGMRDLIHRLGSIGVVPSVFEGSASSLLSVVSSPGTLPSQVPLRTPSAHCPPMPATAPSTTI